MPKKTITLPFSSDKWLTEWTKLKDYLVNETFASKFIRHDTVPFVLVADEEQKCKRFFHTEEEAAIYYEARTNKAMTEEIQAYNFTKETVPGEEQYKLSFNILNVDDASTYGTTAKLRFTFATADTLNNNRPTEESVEIYFTFSSDSGTKTDTKRFTYSTEVTQFDITDYLEPGENTITLVVTGLSSGLSLTTKATYTAVKIDFSSTFDISADRQVGTNFGIPYSISGLGTKTIEFVIDGTTTYNDTVYDGTASKTYTFVNNLAIGLHTLQMKAYTTINNVTYESNLLYFEFVVNGAGLELTATLIQAEFTSGTAYFLNRNPGLVGEQYVDYTLTWCYFSTEQPNATVMWKTKLNGVETVVGSRAIDEMEGTVGVMPDPVKFQPDTVGDYQLYAYIKGAEDTHIGEYTITVVENTAGLREASGYLLKLDAKGRSNDEPDETLADWSDNGYTTTFNSSMSWDGLAGWTGNVLRLDNGATAVNTCKPFAQELAVLTNGGAVTFHFMTRNVEDETIPLIEIGDYNAQSTAYFAIYGKKVLFRPSNGKNLEYEFASEEETHLAVIVNPKTGVTDAQMMFFIFNGITAPGTPYGDTAVFNIGSTAATSDTNGMIKMGDASGKAAIDIYGIRVYNSTLSMWQGMNNYMIDKGGDVATMMKKNNIFTNNNFDTPNINAIKEKFRTLEIIGNLGSLETSNKKVNFYGSCRYTDPFAPKFNFSRLDGGAYNETAGQSRLEDLMAKSFHLDLNENDTVATYQDGKLCHKNRFIFAEGNIPENGVRIDLSGADSSICRNASHMRLVNKYYPYVNVSDTTMDYTGYVLRTPPQAYALSGQWSEDMAAKWGGTKDDYPWPYNINFAPDSVPIVIVWHEKEDDPIQVYGLGMMTEEKKASYANGNHSIYLKEPLSDGTLDPYDRYTGKSGDRGWNNDGVEEVEFVNPSDLTNSVTTAGFDDETTREYSFELCFPKTKDLDDGGVAVWNTFKTEYLQPLADCYNDQTAFDNAIDDIIYMPSFAMYYNKVMDKKMNDSLCRNMHVIRFNMGTESSPKWLWWAKWWDADVSVGLFQSNAMGVDPQTDRQTKDSNGNYVMAGHDMWLWNALENNEKFNKWCKVLAEASYAAGWSATTEKEAEDEITDEFSEGLYNLDGLLKYLYAYRKGNDYMVRMQGRSTPYRHGFIDDSYSYRESLMAIGAYAASSMSFRATNATYPCKVTLTSTVEWRFGLGTTTTNIKTGVVVKPDDGEVSIQIPEGTTLGRDFLSVYGAEKIKTLDVSDFCKYLSVQINLGNLTQIQKLYIGYKTHDALASGDFNNYSGTNAISFTGVDSMTRLVEFSLMGLHGLQSFDFSTLNHLTTLYLSGTGLLNFTPANGTKFTTVELPDTLQTVEARNVTLGDISFWEADLDAKTLTEMTVTPTSLLTLNLVGMGDDEGTHTLVHMWCQMLKANPTLINTAQITYRAIEWGNTSKTKTPMEKEDLLILAQIPSSQRNLTGYIFCDCVYTSDERTILTTAFGENVFNYDTRSTNLVCDGNGDGLSMTGSGDGVTVVSETEINFLQGTSATFTAAGFPIAGTNSENYRFRVYIASENEWTEGSESIPNITFGTNNAYCLNWKTGVLTSTEHSTSTETFKVGCYDCETHINGEMTVNAIPCSYPTEVSTELKSSTKPTSVVSGEIQITSSGTYLFDAVHKRIVSGEEVEYNGTMTLTDGGVWQLVNEDSRYVSRNSTNETDPFIDYCLQVTALPEDDVKMTLKYTSNWKGGVTLTADDVKLVIFAVIAQLVINDPTSGNVPMFNALVSAGLAHTAIAYYSSAEVKNLTGTFSPATLLGEDASTLVKLTNGTYYLPQYFKNVTGFDLSNCTGLNGQTIDCTKTPWAQSYSFEGTSMNPKVGSANTSLTSLTIGSPTSLEIDNPPILSADGIVDETYAFAYTSLKLKNLYNGGTFKKMQTLTSITEWISNAHKLNIPIKNIIKAYTIDNNIKKSFDGTGRWLCGNGAYFKLDNSYSVTAFEIRFFFGTNYSASYYRIYQIGSFVIMFSTTNVGWTDTPLKTLTYNKEYLLNIKDGYYYVNSVKSEVSKSLPISVNSGGGIFAGGDVWRGTNMKLHHLNLGTAYFIPIKLTDGTCTLIDLFTMTYPTKTGTFTIE